MDGGMDVDSLCLVFEFNL